MKLHQTCKNICLKCIFVKGMFSKGLMHGPGVFTQAGGLKYEVSVQK